MSVEAHKETLNFQTEVKQLLNLMIHSLYSNKEIFLRELISNASDAVDKLRFEALTDDALFEGDGDLKVRVTFDKEQRTITVTDNGIGMNRAEVLENIGTIAKSGTKAFFESLTGEQSKDNQLIGQFGVGFYSVFIVADKVVLKTRRAGLEPSHGVLWESGGEGDFSIETIEKAERGTDIVLHLREGEEYDEFLDGFKLRSIIRKFSDHIPIPIEMEKDVPVASDNVEADDVIEGEVESEGEDDTKAEAETKDDEKKDDTAEEATAVEYERVNQASALWMRSKTDISKEEYHEFYKHISHDFQEPMQYVHSKVEGKHEYTSLFYIPSHAPYDLWDREKRQGIKLYVRRVFIMDDAEHLMPQYLRFVKGVIDSNDLPLNISREILQHNKIIESIKSASVKKILGLLEKLAKDEPEKYQTFWKEFGKVMKEGPAEDFSHKERIAKLFRFASTHNDTEEQTVSLEDYVARMKEGQEKIYYVTADSFAAAKHSPHLEVFRSKGIEVLLLHERVDEWLTSHLHEFDGKPLQSVTKGDLDLGKMEDEESKKDQEKVEEEQKDFVEKIKTALGEQVKDVKVSHRLTSSPACLVKGEYDMSGNLERILQASGQGMPMSKPTLEINPSHALVNRIREESDEQRFKDWAQILLDQALLSEGGQLEDPASFVQRFNGLILAMSEAKSA